MNVNMQIVIFFHPYNFMTMKRHLATARRPISHIARFMIFKFLSSISHSNVCLVIVSN